MESIPNSDLEKFAEAKSNALTRVRMLGIRDEKRHTSCSVLFQHSPLGLTGGALLGNYALFRYDNGTVPGSICGPHTFAWVNGSLGSRVIFICPSFFNIAPPDSSYMLIHELLHVAGQMENLSVTVGPGDPPTTAQIQQIVEEACANPYEL